MSLKINLLSISIVLAITGCASSGPVNLAKNGTCNFDAIQGESYRLSPAFSPYVTNNFFYDEKTEKIQQLDKTRYTSLVNNPFKILKTGITTAEDNQNRAPYLESYRYDEVSFDGIPYKRDQTYSTQVITSSCDVFYLAGKTSKSSIESDILKTDGKKLSDSELKKFISPLALTAIDFDASTTHDNFKKISTIETPTFDDLLIRGAVNDKDNKILFIQLYANLTFFNDWGNIKLAYDTNGETHKVVSINTDANCASSNLFGCRLTETVGADLSKDFLVNHPDGFEIKFTGTQERIVKVPKMMVQSFLSAIKQAK